MKLHHVLYRDLLAIARQLDRHASLRALISSNMLVKTVVGKQETRLPQAQAYNMHLLEFLSMRSYYLPSREHKTAESIVREQFRCVPAEGVGLALDTAFLALKQLSDRLSFATSVGVLNATATEPLKRKAVGKVRTREDVTIAQALREEAVESSRSAMKVEMAERVQTGVFLLAHPLMDGIFGRSVVLLTEYSPRGTRGFIVNRPTKQSAAKAFKLPPHIAREFGANKVHRGGPVPTSAGEIFHNRAELGGTRLVNSNFRVDASDDLFQDAELEVAAEAVKNGTFKPHDLVIMNGVSSWTAGQLDDEMKRGAWVAVRAPLSLAIGAKKDLWSELMGKLGGEYEEFSRMPELDDEYDDDDASDDDDSDSDD